ncbi:hypothetical protein M409DRAFT_23708 [Zasmidium cellare ATCC 36951]|uniref:DUF7730 domain-containing protein n=1 Tax=Zasmidium cellare ATCC 36951 TaxID=1080233 RepID=A0A6A6CFZ6_ZASCE|nr:uncharacterized protein M409DRAFT_23708 [Zasmidium cellare ATCC 36951]KAF2165981.1 hypothetical protein M409DRAFT_23708 [Zasmidium cellare ATCC 36951]
MAPQASGLFKLPLELRQLIYEYVFTKEVRITSPPLSRDAVAVLRKRGVPCLPPLKAPPFGVKQKNIGLLATCRQIRSEAIKFYYRCTIFSCPASANVLRTYLDSIPTLQYQEIGTIHVWMLFKLGSRRDTAVEYRRKLKAKLINLEAELLHSGITIRPGALMALAPLSVPKGEPSHHVWTSEPTDVDLEDE